MIIPFILPLDIPVDGMEHQGPEFGWLEPLLGFGTAVLIIAMLLAAFLLLRQRGALSALYVPRWWPPRSPSPEESAKQILAERLARGDLTAGGLPGAGQHAELDPGSNRHCKAPSARLIQATLDENNASAAALPGARGWLRSCRCATSVN